MLKGGRVWGLVGVCVCVCVLVNCFTTYLILIRIIPVRLSAVAKPTKMLLKRWRALSSSLVFLEQNNMVGVVRRIRVPTYQSYVTASIHD